MVDEAEDDEEEEWSRVFEAVSEDEGGRPVPEAKRGVVMPEEEGRAVKTPAPPFFSI